MLLRRKRAPSRADGVKAAGGVRLRRRSLTPARSFGMSGALEGRLSRSGNILTMPGDPGH